MASDVAGKYYAKSFTTADADEDIMQTLKTLSGDTSMSTAKKLRLFTEADFDFSVNGGPLCDLNTTGEILFDAKDVFVNSLVIHEANSAVFVEIFY